ncbi:MAG: uracil-DNA glycosylase [Victivallaceae bacterium]|nr:uracil-DNA glycosylase [Victivallaceae bacterium]
MDRLPENWSKFIGFPADEFDALMGRLAAARAVETVFPPDGMVFRAFELTSPDAVRVVILGQDPYHGDGEADGLSFAVPEGVRLPPSLRNIFKEFASDLGCAAPEAGDLEEWACSGVLMLNSVLSVAAHCPGSHRKLGWERFTDAVIAAVSAKLPRCAFILWGNYAIGKKPLIDPTRHLVLESVHPSPLSAHRGFFGSRPFSKTEEFLAPWCWLRPEKKGELFL